MGCYTYLIESDLIKMRKVKDADLNSLFQEALSHDKSLMIYEHHFTTKKLFRKPVIHTHYFVKHEYFLSSGNSAMEARDQISASGDKKVVVAYLYGIINGSLSAQRKQRQ